MYSFKEGKRLNKMEQLDELYDIICQKNPNDIKIIIELINKNKDIIKYDNGTLIRHAIYMGNAGILNLLFKYGIDPNKCFEIDFDENVNNTSCYKFNVDSETYDIFEYALNEFDVDVIITISPLCYALLVKNISFSIIRTIIDYGGQKIYILNPIEKMRLLYEQDPKKYYYIGDILGNVIFESFNNINVNTMGYKSGVLRICDRLICGVYLFRTRLGHVSGKVYKRNFKILCLLISNGVFTEEQIYNILYNIEFDYENQTNEKMCNYLKEHYDDILDKYKSMANSVSNNNNLPTEITNNILVYLIKF